MKGFFDYTLLTILPFWHELFSFIGSIVWPIMLFSALLLFRNPLSNLISRIKDLSVAGAAASFSSQISKASIEDLSESDFPVLKGIEITDAVKLVESKVREFLATIGDDEKLSRVIRELAISRLDTEFAIAHGLIFGSQIELLRLIRQAGFLDRSTVLSYFERVKKNFEIYQHSNVNEYLQFLFSKELIKEEGVQLSLTPFGHDYLLFLYRRNVIDRPF